MIQYQNEKKCTYKNESYSVRDNGTVYRHARPNKPMRKYDNVWTSGTNCTKGYKLIVSVPVHLIIATAFHGGRPSDSHVVDHINTIRYDNRPENLRWVTRRENIHDNELTKAKIIRKYGSFERFYADPLNPPNLDLESDSKLNEEVDTVPSLTENAIQKNWFTPTEFLQCPVAYGEDPLEDYMCNLIFGRVFSTNRFGKARIHLANYSEDFKSLWVICKMENNVKDWSLVKITYDGQKFVHESSGTFFSYEGALKYYTIERGLEWEGGETFDDYC